MGRARRIKSGLGRVGALAAVVAVVVCVGLGLGAERAEAAGEVMELHLVADGSGGKMLVAVSDEGVTLIRPKELKPFRAWKSKRKAMRGATQDWFVLRDVDSNGSVDLVVNGSPAFIVSGGGAPISALPRGCDQVYVGDFVADKSQEVVCRKGNSIRATTHDGQFAWEYKISGLKLGVCHFGDANGDLKDDVECEIKGKGAWLRLNGPTGEELGRGFDSETLGPVDDDNPGYAEEVANILQGNAMFDFNGDGTAEESLLMDGEAVVMRSKAKKVAMGRHDVGKITAALVDDIDGDGDLEAVLGGQGKVFVLDHTGKLAATITTSPGKLRRESAVELTGLNANALADTSEATIRKVVDGATKKLAGCYSANVKRDPYTKVGRTMWRLVVNDKGAVTKAERFHSDLNDKKVESCLSGALKRMKFPKATGPGASVTLTLMMGFVDR